MKFIDLTGKVAVITGGSQGLGLATAKALHSAGATVVLNYFPDPDGNNRTRADAAVSELKDRAIALPGDVRDRTSIDSMLGEVLQQL